MNDCDDQTCLAPDAASHTYHRRAVQVHLTSTEAAFALSPFFFTFVVVAFFAWSRLFPLLSGTNVKANVIPETPATRRTFSLSQSKLRASIKYLWDRAAAITFSTTIALSALLAELIFCEIADLFEPAARKLALEATISILLASLIVVTPALEIHSITTATGIRDGSRAKFILAAFIDVLGLGLWLGVFWAVGQAVIGGNAFLPEDISHSRWTVYTAWLKAERQTHGLTQGSLERIGIIGISLMASLAGFAAISSIWQSFGARVRKVSDTDITRKQAGLDATSDLLSTKESRLRTLERKISSTPPPNQRQISLVTRLVGSLRPDSDNQELSALRLEISGLTTMQSQLNNSLSLLKARRATQLQASTALGRLCLTTAHIFSIYCLYRIVTTTLAVARRWHRPLTTTGTSSADPITNALALAARYWNPHLDRAAWSRQISFLLSGLMLLASFNAVLQTILLFGRIIPTKIMISARENMALLASQICATYVVSSALLLRSNLPREMGGLVTEALGAPLDVSFVERWFEGWFLGTCVVTAVGILVSRKIVGNNVDWDDEYDDDSAMEAGKRLA